MSLQLLWLGSHQLKRSTKAIIVMTTTTTTTVTEMNAKQRWRWMRNKQKRGIYLSVCKLFYGFTCCSTFSSIPLAASVTSSLHYQATVIIPQGPVFTLRSSFVVTAITGTFKESFGKVHDMTLLTSVIVVEVVVKMQVQVLWSIVISFKDVSIVFLSPWVCCPFVIMI